MNARLSLRSLFVLVISLLICCAQAQEAPASVYKTPLHGHKVVIWSAVGQLEGTSEKQSIFTKDSFENQFNAALKLELSALGVVSEVHPHYPDTDTLSSMTRFEHRLSPSRRLIIQPTKAAFREYGGVNILYAQFDVILFDVVSGKRIWQTIVVRRDGERIGKHAWNDIAGREFAKEFAEILVYGRRQKKPEATTVID